MDEPQFLSLIQTYQPMLHKICRVYRQLKHEQEDLFQEIIYQLWKSHQSYKGTAQLTTWVYRVALNTALTDIRKKKPDIRYANEIPDIRSELPDNQQREQEELLTRALQQLSDGEKTIITLYLESLSYKEISNITGISESNVGVKLNRIKVKLQKLLNNGTK